MTASNSTKAEDRKLVLRAQAGDGLAFDELVRRHQDLIFNLLRRLGVRQQDAEDMLQDIFIKAYRSLQRFNLKSAFSTWLYSIALNEWRSWQRSRKRRRLLPFLTGSGPGDAEDGPELEPPDPGPGPEEVVHRRLQLERVEKLLERMHPALREALVLRDIQELEYQEISQLLGVPIGTVKSRINRARGFLAKKMENRG